MKLLEPFSLKSIPLRNRILRSATWEALADHEGYLSPEQYRVYQELAKNHVGLICTGYARVDSTDRPNAGMMGIYDDLFIPQYQKLTELIHHHGAAAMMQIAYGGTKTTYEVENRTIFAPGRVPERTTNVTGTPMSTSDISRLVAEYAAAARRVKAAGFDMVEVHGGHSYLLNQFLSPYYNDRTDAYGGSLENRYRIVDEILKAMRAEVGVDYPIGIKITCSDFFDGGMTFAQSLEICKLLERSGVDLIEVSGNIHATAQKQVGASFDGHTLRGGGYFYEYAKEIADAVQIPVFATGGYCDPQQMETMLNESKLQGFGMSRPFLCEPALIKRWENGDLSKAKCLHCSRCRTPEGNYCTVFKGKDVKEDVR